MGRQQGRLSRRGGCSGKDGAPRDTGGHCRKRSLALLWTGSVSWRGASCGSSSLACSPGPPQHQSCTGQPRSLGREALSKEATTVRSADLIRGLMRKCLWTGLPE